MSKTKVKKTDRTDREFKSKKNTRQRFRAGSFRLSAREYISGGCRERVRGNLADDNPADWMQDQENGEPQNNRAQKDTVR